MSCGPIMELIIYVGVYFMSFPLSLKHIRDSYRDRTGKMRSFFEVRFMSRHASYMCIILKIVDFIEVSQQNWQILQPLFPSMRTLF